MEIGEPIRRTTVEPEPIEQPESEPEREPETVPEEETEKAA